MNTNAAMRAQRTASPQVFLRRRLLPVLVAGCFGTALANPLGPQVINGQASFVNQGNVLSVTNTPGTIINWQSFSINPSELTRFIQQNPNSAVLNRITGGDPSQILGALQSNGRVFLVNPNGILFGPGAQVDVNGLVASTLNISNEDFLNGKMLFKAGDHAGNLKNQGAITTPAGGQVVLIAPNVENSGIITSPKGEVMLAAGHTVELVDTANTQLRVVLSAPEHEALNLGQVIAQGGKTGIYGALVKQRGIINADSAVVGENGKVVLKASRDTLLEAGSRTSAKGAGKGGEIQVLGERVGLTGDAQVDASGQLGGGTVLVGGDYQGKNDAVQNAKRTYVGTDAQIKADAIDNGDGGKVIVWADEIAHNYGAISARGGSQGGDGGFVEVSGKEYLDFQARVDLGATQGAAGTLLLHPYDIEVKTAGGSGILSNFDAFSDLPATGTSLVSAAAISGSGTNVVLQAKNDILFTDAVAITAAGVSLTAQAGNSITVGNSITTNGGAILLSANDPGGTQTGAGGVTLNAAVATNGSGATNGGAVTLSGASIGVSAGLGSISTGGGTTGGAVTLTSTGTMDLRGTISTSSAAAGNITGTAQGNIEIRGAISASGSPGGVVNITSNSGNIKIFDGGGSITASGANGKVKLTAAAGSITTDDTDTVITAGDVILKGATGIHGNVTAGPPVTTYGMQINASNLDIKNTSSGNVQVHSTSALAVKDLDTDSFSLVQGASSSVAVVGSDGSLSIDNDTSTFSTGSYYLYAGGALIADTPLQSTNGLVSLSGTSITVNEDLTAHTVKLKTDSLTVNNSVAKITATGTPTSTTSGGVFFEPMTLSSVIVGAGAGLQINPSLLKSSAPAVGEIGSGYFEFNAGSTGTVNIASPISLSASSMSFKAGTVALNNNVTGKSVRYVADALFLGVGFVTTASGTDDGILVAPWTASTVTTIAAATPGSGLWIDSGKLGNFVAKYLKFGDIGSSGTPVSSGNIVVSAPIAGAAGTFKNLGFATTGNISQASVADIISLPTCTGCGELSITGGYTNLNVAPNSVDSFTATGNSVLFKNSKALTSPFIVASYATGPVNLSVNGSFTSTGAIKSNNGNITISTTGANQDITISPPGINACYNVSGACTSSVTLTATGSISIPLVNAGTNVTLNAGGNVIDADGSLNNITSPAGSVQLSYTVSGNINLDAWGATAVAGSTVAGTNNLRLTQPSSGGGSAPATPTPTLDQCVSNPSTSGCSGVLPTVDACTADPTKSGCSAVLPTISTCTTAPSTAGCSAVLPTLDACTSTPTKDGCSAVLPSVTVCETNPTAAGCSVVLPDLGKCTTAPTTAGCSVVLPSLGICEKSPTTAGCSAVLPTVDSCTINPAQTGCSVVLPTLSSCTSAPSTAGCSAVLPTLSACTTAPSTAGCTAVLPTLAQCSANPTQDGCSVVVPAASKCVANPTAPDCQTVLPVTETKTATATLTDTVADTTNTVLTTTVSVQASTTKVQSGSGSSSGGASSRPAEQSSDKSEEKKDDKKTTSPADDSGAKKNEPAKKMYCN